MSDHPDPFAALGLDRRYDLSDADIAARRADRLYAAAGRADEAARVEAAAAVLADPWLRAEALLPLVGGPAVGTIPHLPTVVRDRVDALGQRLAEAGSPVDAAQAREAVAAERATRLDRIARLFAALRGGDNPIVQNQRKRDVATELLAVRELGRVLGVGKE